MKLYLILFSIFTAISLKSQNQIGIRSGVLFSKYENESGAESSNVIGLEIGGLTKFSLPHGVYIQPEVTYLQKGGNIDFIIGELSVKTNQIEVSAAVGYGLKLGQLSFFTNIGAFYGYILNKPTDEDPFDSIVLKKVEKSWDWGSVFGIGLGTTVGKGELGIEGRYRRSHNKFSTTSYGTVVGDPDFRITLENRSWGINISYRVFLN